MLGEFIRCVLLRRLVKLFALVCFGVKSLRKGRHCSWKRSEGSDSIFITIGLGDDTTFDSVSKKMLDVVLMFDVVVVVRLRFNIHDYWTW